MPDQTEKTAYVLTAAQRRYLPVKRALDVCLAAPALAVLALPMLLTALARKITTPHAPVLFRQTRVGRGGVPFTIWKFRTMDERGVTGPLGRFLRRTSIDELPQLAQVLTGKMSLVGPRPLIPEEETVHALRRAAGVYALRPGLTGWAQINGRDLLSDRAKAAYDREYLEKLGLGTDAAIVLRTVWKVLARQDIREKEM